MTTDELIAEGRKLQRPCVFLRPEGDGPVAAVWHGREWGKLDYIKCWISVVTDAIPAIEMNGGIIHVIAHGSNPEIGHVELSTNWQHGTGVELYAHPSTMLPPIDAVFLLGSSRIGEWLRENNWTRRKPYNNNFPGRKVVEVYEDVCLQEDFTLHRESNVYAMLGGWHLPWPEGDWYDYLDKQLAIFTIRDSEPWIEVWYTATKEFELKYRIT